MGVHLLITQSDWTVTEPWCYLVAGGISIGDVDLGYGPARALKSPEVKAFDAAIQSIPVGTLEERYKPDEMAVFSPNLTAQDEDLEQEDEDLEYYKHYFLVLRDFVRSAAKEDMGLLIWSS